MSGLLKYGSLTLLVLVSVVLSFLIHHQDPRAQSPGPGWSASDPSAAVETLLRTQGYSLDAGGSYSKDEKDAFSAMDAVKIPGKRPDGKVAYKGYQAYGFKQPMKLTQVDVQEGTDFKLGPRFVSEKVRQSAFPTLKVEGSAGEAGGVSYAPGRNATITPDPRTKPPKTGTWKLTPKATAPTAYYTKMYSDPATLAPKKTFPTNAAELSRFLDRIAEASNAGRSLTAKKVLPGTLNNESPTNFQLRVRLHHGQPTKFEVRPLGTGNSE